MDAAAAGAPRPGAGFLSRTIGGVRHLLAHARAEPGLVHATEIGPTVQWTPGDQARLTGQAPPPFLDALLSAGPGRILYEAVHSEEGAGSGTPTAAIS